jgi:hypothetical protein
VPTAQDCLQRLVAHGHLGGAADAMPGSGGAGGPPSAAVKPPMNSERPIEIPNELQGHLTEIPNELQGS